MGAALAGLLIYGGVLGVRRGVAVDAAVPASASSEPEPPGRARLIGEIAALDDGFYEGGIDPATYASRRAELKALVLNAGAVPGDQRGNQQDNPETESDPDTPSPRPDL